MQIGALQVRIGADTSGLQSGLNRAQSQARSFSNSIGPAVARLGALSAAAGAAGLAFGTKLVLSTAKAADELAKLSAKTGITVEDLSRMRHAADLSGVAHGELTNAVFRLSRQMDEAAQGNASAASSFARLGVSVTNADGTLRDANAVMMDLADRFAEMPDGAQKTALAIDVFGRAGANMIPMLNQGSKGLREMHDEADRLGITMRTEVAQAAEVLNDNLTRMRNAARGTAQQFAGPLVMAFANFTTKLLESRREANALYNELGRTGAINEATAAFIRLGDAIARSLNNWSEFFLKSGQAQVDMLVAERESLRDQIETLEARSGRGGPARQRQLQEARERIEQINEEIRVLQNLRHERDRDAAAIVITGAAETSAEIVQAQEVAQELARVQTESQDEREDSHQRFLERRLEQLRYAALQEHEQVQHDFEERERLLEEMREQNLIGEQEHYHLLETARQEHADKMMDIAQREKDAAEAIEKDKQKTIEAIQEGMFRNLIAGMNSGSRAMFNIARLASIAQSLLAAREAITQSYKVGARIGGPKLGAAYAATAAAATAAQLASLRSVRLGSTSASGGTGGTGGAGGGAVSGVADAAASSQGGRDQTITVRGISAGDILTGDAVRTLIEGLIDAQRNGARIVLS